MKSKKQSKSNLFKKVARPDNLKMKKGGYHNIQKGDAKQMRKSKKQDINKQMMEASMTTAIKGYLASVKAFGGNAPKESRPWYLSNKEVTTSLAENLSVIANHILKEELGEEEELADPMMQRYLQAIARADARTHVPDEPLPAGLMLKKKLDAKVAAGEVEDPNKIIRKDKRDFHKDIKKYRSKGSKMSRSQLGGGARSALDEYMLMLQATIAATQFGGEENADDHQALYERLKQLPKAQITHFLNTKIISYPMAMLRVLNARLQKKGSRPVNEKASQYSDPIWRMFEEQISPRLVEKFLNYYLENQHEIATEEAERLKASSISVGGDSLRGEGSRMKGLGGGNKNVASSSAPFGTPDETSEFNIDDFEGEDEGFNTDEDEFARQMEKRSQLKGLQNLAADFDGSDEDEQPDEVIDDIFRKAAKAAEDGRLTYDKAVEAFGDMAKNPKLRLSTPQMRYLASKVVLNPRFVNKALNQISQKLASQIVAAREEAGVSSEETPEEVMKRVKHRSKNIFKSMLTQGRGDGLSYTSLSSPSTTHLPSEDQKLAKLIYHSLSPDQLLRKSFLAHNKVPQNPVVDYIENELQRKEAEQGREQEGEAHAKQFRRFARSRRKERKEPQVSSFKHDDESKVLRKKTPEELKKSKRDALAARGFAKARKAEGEEARDFVVAPSEKDLEPLRNRKLSLAQSLKRMSPDDPRREKEEALLAKISKTLEKREELLKKYPRQISAKVYDPSKEDEEKPKAKKVKSTIASKKKRDDSEEKPELSASQRKTLIKMWDRQGLDKEQINKKLAQYNARLIERKLPKTMSNLKKLMQEDLLQGPSLIEMLMSPESTEDEIEVPLKTGGWETAKLAKKKNFLKHLSMEGIRRMKK